MNIITIILFFVYTWGLGYTATSFIKNSENTLERNLMRLAIGLGVIPIILILMNFLHIPLDWKILLILSIIYPIFALIKKISKKQLPKLSLKLKIKKSDMFVLVVILLFIFSFYMYSKGAFGYPYLENEDPWGHSVGVKYVALEKTAYDPVIINATRQMDPVLSFMDPYPPAYDAFMGILHQISPSMKWTLKFFNALIISLGIIFFYFFAKQFIGDQKKALFSTFVLAMIPCYLSHFIWAHSLVITLFFPLFYAFERIKIDKKWAFIAALIFASIWVTQNLSQPLKISTLLAIYLIVESIAHKKLQKEAIFATIGGFLLSLVWWLVMVSKYSFSTFISYYGVREAATETAAAATQASSNIFAKIFQIIPKLFSAIGTGSRAYTFSDFFVAKGINMINNPIGIGVFISLLTLISVVYVLYKNKTSIVTSKHHWIAVCLFWLIYTFLGVNGETFHIYVARGAFRVWMLMAIIIALICSEGLVFLIEKSKKAKIPPIIVISIFILGIVFTSGIQKYTLNTSVWPSSGSFSVQGEAEEYAKWFDTLPKNTNVFLYAPRDKITIGLDGHTCSWCQDVIDFRKDIMSKNASELYNFLKRNKYEYLAFSRMDFKYLAKDDNSTQLLTQRIDEAASSPLFQPVYQVEGILLALKVN